MSRLLYIESSPRKQRSASITVARQFLDAYREKNPHATVETLDLWEAKLPPFDGAALEAKFAILSGEPVTPSQREAWRAIERIADHFKSADKYVLSVPMWNFSIPYVLKHYIDLLVQPGLTVSFTHDEGFKGLVTGKPALTILARGASYAAGSPLANWDQQSEYLRNVLGFIGFTDIKSILVEPTVMDGVQGRNRAMAAARKEAEELALAF